MPPAGVQGTQWIATLNNPTDEETKQLMEFQAKEIVVDEEVGEEGTRHYHIYLRLTKRAVLSTMHKLVPRAHWELAPNREAAVNYCSKGRVLRRELAGKGKSSDLEAALALLQSEGVDAARRAYPKQYVLHSRGFEALAYSLLDQREKTAPQVFWYWGATGTGKSRKAIGDEVSQNNIYIQRGPNSKGACMWWDGYVGQKRVVLDDFRPWWCPFSFLLGLLDRYPIRVQVKGGFVNFVPEEIIITTPKNIQETFQEFRCQEDIDQVVRRVHHQVHFCSL